MGPHGVDEQRTLDALSSAVLAVTRHLSVREVLQTIVIAARELIDCEYAALGIPDDEGAFAEFLVDGISDAQREAIGALPRQHGLLGAMLRKPTPERLADIRADPRFGWWPAAHPVLKDFLGVPIVDGTEILGAIYLANRRGRVGFTEADERLLGVLAAHAAIALVNARLYERERELTLVRERQRIARELHDAVAQKLFSLHLTAEAAGALVRRDPDRAEAELRQVSALAGQAATELRQIVDALRPRELADSGLVETLRARVALLDRVHDAAVDFDAPDGLRLAAPVEEALLRIAEEALHNALRHARATRVTVRLTGEPRTVTLEVCDDGIGIGDTAASGDRTQLGLASMRERAEGLGGTLAVRSPPAGGTAIVVAVPRDRGIVNGPAVPR